MANPLDLTQLLTFKYLFRQCFEELSAFLGSVLHQSTRSPELASGTRSGSMSYQKAIEMDLCAPSEMNECEMWMYYLKNHHRKQKRRNHSRNHEKK